MTATPAQRKAYLDALALGMTKTLAAKAACVDRNTPDDWCERDPEYAAKVEEAMGSRLMRHFRTVTKAAQQGDWRASVWLLSVLHPEECGKQRLEVTGKNGGPVQVDLEIQQARAMFRAALELTPEQRAAVRAGDGS